MRWNAYGGDLRWRHDAAPSAGDVRLAREPAGVLRALPPPGRSLLASRSRSHAGRRERRASSSRARSLSPRADDANADGPPQAAGGLRARPSARADQAGGPRCRRHRTRATCCRRPKRAAGARGRAVHSSPVSSAMIHGLRARRAPRCQAHARGGALGDGRLPASQVAFVFTGCGQIVASTARTAGAVNPKRSSKCPSVMATSRVPCWIDTSQPDPEAAAEFYGGLFGCNPRT